MRLLLRSVLASMSISLIWCQNATVIVSIDANANRHAINPLVYGVSFGTAATLSDLNIPLHRMGGNSASQYNWLANADNRGGDWFFESLADTSATAGERGDTFIALSKSAGAQPMITVPMVGWVAKLGSNRQRLSSFSVSKYGAQTATDPWFPDAGSGTRSNGQLVTGNDPNDANLPADSLFQQGWVNHIVSTWGSAASGGLTYYILDNEHSLWHSTHRDTHPIGAHATEIRDQVIDYSAKIKAVDPSAVVVGPEEWGWSGYFLSGFDQQYGSLHGWSSLPDHTNVTGGMDYIPWLLSQWKATGGRPIDMFSVHYYPQGGEFGNDTSTSMQLRRNRSTRSLWDPAYVDESWIGSTVQLIPRLKNWVNTYYFAGTPVAITEYNWGADGHINGATAQADILGIFGREGLDAAARWTAPDAATPVYQAIRLYRNYDGNKSGFGDVSVAAVAPNPDDVASFAAIRSQDGALTIMVVNKVLSGTTPVTLNLANFSASSAQQYQLTASNAITRLADAPLANNALSVVVPAQSITLLVLPAGTPTVDVPPVAVLAATPSAGVAPLVVSFTSTGSSDPDGTISSYAWSFGDGMTGTGPAAFHTYQSAGTYNASLMVTDNAGLSATSNQTITVTDPPPPPTSGCAIGYAVTNDWGNGFQASVTITNASKVAVNGWNLRWTYPGTQQLSYMWNATYSQSGAVASVNNASWNANINPGGQVSFGFNANYTGSNPKPTAFTLNGATCDVH